MERQYFSWIAGTRIRGIPVMFHCWNLTNKSTTVESPHSSRCITEWTLVQLSAHSEMSLYSVSRFSELNFADKTLWHNVIWEVFTYLIDLQKRCHFGEHW